MRLRVNIKLCNQLQAAGNGTHKNDRIMILVLSRHQHRTELQDWVSSPVAEKSPAPEQYRAIN
jgi:hypothetical protein